MSETEYGSNDESIHNIWAEQQVGRLEFENDELQKRIKELTLILIDAKRALTNECDQKERCGIVDRIIQEIT